MKCGVFCRFKSWWIDRDVNRRIPQSDQQWQSQNLEIQNSAILPLLRVIIKLIMKHIISLFLTFLSSDHKHFNAWPTVLQLTLQTVSAYKHCHLLWVFMHPASIFTYWMSVRAVTFFQHSRSLSHASRPLSFILVVWLFVWMAVQRHFSITRLIAPFAIVMRDVLKSRL